MKLIAPALLCSGLLLWCCDQDKSPQTPGKEPAAPRVRLRISGDLRGALEPCGCASGQLGGLARRVFKLHADPDYDVLIEGGNVASGGLPLDLKKTFTALSALDLGKRRYQAIGIGPLDLEQDPDIYADVLGVLRSPLVASDLVAAKGFEWPVKAFAEHEVEPSKDTRVRVRIASLAITKPKSATGAKLEQLAPEAAWKRALEGSAPETYRILLVHDEPEGVRKLAALSPKPDLIVGMCEGMHEPKETPELDSGVPIVWPGIHGRFLIDVTLARIGAQPSVTKYRKIPLEGSPSSPGAMEDEATKNLIMQHRREVAAEDILTQMAERIPAPGGASYVGTSVCGNCHAAALVAWQKSKHAQAWQTLEDAASGKLKQKGSDKPRYGWPVTAYPDCVGCHVVGYGQVSGFVNPTKTPHLTNVGCENCHGPGSAHAEARTKGQPLTAGKMGRCNTSLCTNCHNFEQSPTFDYAERWKKVEHGK